MNEHDVDVPAMVEELRTEGNEGLADAIEKANPWAFSGRKVRLYIEPRDWWVGYYRGDDHHYVCLLPTVVIRWRRSTSPTASSERSAS